MRSLPRRLDHRAFAAVAALPSLAAGQGTTADGAATGASPWNWVIGVAALAIVIAMAWDLFGPAGRRRSGAPPVG